MSYENDHRYEQPEKLKEDSPEVEKEAREGYKDRGLMCVRCARPFDYCECKTFYHVMF